MAACSHVGPKSSQYIYREERAWPCTCMQLLFTTKREYNVHMYAQFTRCIGRYQLDYNMYYMKSSTDPHSLESISCIMHAYVRQLHNIMIKIRITYPPNSEKSILQLRFDVTSIKSHICTITLLWECMNIILAVPLLHLSIAEHYSPEIPGDDNYSLWLYMYTHTHTTYIYIYLTSWIWH